MAVSGANTHDMRLVDPTLKNFAIRHPRPKSGAGSSSCGDKGYDYADTRRLVQRWGYTLHIKSRGDEAKAINSALAKIGGHGLLARHVDNRMNELTIPSTLVTQGSVNAGAAYGIGVDVMWWLFGPFSAPNNLHFGAE